MKISDVPSFLKKQPSVGQFACICMPTFIAICMILDMHMFTCVPLYSLLFFKVFKIFLFLIILYCLKTYCYIFDL